MKKTRQPKIRRCPTCSRTCDKAWHLTCATCWSLVPKDLQDNLYREYRKEQGSPAHIGACREALRSIYDAKGGSSK